MKEHPSWLTMIEAAAWIGSRRSGRPTHKHTIRGWCLHGIKGVKLRSAMIGLVRVTTKKWLMRFFREIAAATEPEQVEVPETSGKLQRRYAKAHAEAERKGLLRY